LAVWLLLFAAGIAATPQLAQVLQGGGFTDPNAPGQQAADLIKTRLGQGSTTLVVVVKGGSLDVRSAAFQEQEEQVLAKLKAAEIPGLQSILTYAGSGAPQLVSKDGKSSVAVLTFDTSAQAVQKQIEAIRAVLAQATRSTQLTTYLTGEPAVNADL
jgi:hypothetical protein